MRRTRTATLSVRSKRGFRTSAGWVLGIGRLGAALGPIGIGFALSAGLAPHRTFYFAATAAVLAALCLQWLGRMRSRSPTPFMLADPRALLR